MNAQERDDVVALLEYELYRWSNSWFTFIDLVSRWTLADGTVPAGPWDITVHGSRAKAIKGLKATIAHLKALNLTFASGSQGAKR